MVKVNVIKELKSKTVEVIDMMKKSLGDFEMKVLKNEIKALGKIARKKYDKNRRDKKKTRRGRKNRDNKSKNDNKSRIRRTKYENNRQNKRIRIDN